MNLIIQGRNLDIPSNVEEYITKKISRVTKPLSNILETKVEVAHEATKSKEDQFVVQATLNCNGTILRAEERAGNIMTAMDSVADVLDRQVERYKGKAYRNEMAKKTGRGVSIRDPGLLEEQEASGVPEEDGAVSKVVRIKRFSLKPLSVDEAATQMELLGHSFFMFLNDTTGEINVVYRRKDGNYGILEPQMG